MIALNHRDDHQNSNFYPGPESAQSSFENLQKLAAYNLESVLVVANINTTK